MTVLHYTDFAAERGRDARIEIGKGVAGYPIAMCFETAFERLSQRPSFRDTVPIALGDLHLTFGGQLKIPAEVVFLHPEHNFTFLRYDPKLIGDTKVRAAKLRPRALHNGDRVWLVGMSSRQDLVARKTQVERQDPVVLPIPNPPRFRQTNTLLTTLTELPPTVGGVLADRRGRVHALWSSFSTERENKPSSFFGGFPIGPVVDALEAMKGGRALAWRTLGVELALLGLDAREALLEPLFRFLNV